MKKLLVIVLIIVNLGVYGQRDIMYPLVKFNAEQNFLKVVRFTEDSEGIRIVLSFTNTGDKAINPYDIITLRGAPIQVATKNPYPAAGHTIARFNPETFLPKKWKKFQLQPRDSIVWEFRFGAYQGVEEDCDCLKFSADFSTKDKSRVTNFSVYYSAPEKIEIQEDAWYALNEIDRINRMNVQGIKFTKDYCVLRCYAYNYSFIDKDDYNFRNYSVFIDNLPVPVLKVAKPYNIKDNAGVIDLIFSREKNKAPFSKVRNSIAKIDLWFSGRQVYKGEITATLSSYTYFNEDASYFYAALYRSILLGPDVSRKTIDSIKSLKSFSLDDYDEETLKSFIAKKIFVEESATKILNKYLHLNSINYLKTCNCIDNTLLAEKAFNVMVNQYDAQSTQNFIDMFPGSRDISKAKAVLAQALVFEKRKEENREEERRQNESNTWDYSITKTGSGNSYNVYKAKLIRGEAVVSYADIFVSYSSAGGSVHINYRGFLDDDGNVIIYAEESEETAIKRLLRQYLKSKYAAKNFRF